MFKGLKMNLQLMVDAGAGGGTPNQTDGGTNTDTGAGEGFNAGATENNTPSFDDVLGQNKDYKAVYCGWHRNGKIVIPKRKGNLGFELLSGDSLIYTNTIMMWKNIAEKIGGWDERFRRNQEAAFLLRYFKYGFSIGVIEECLVEFDTSDRRNQLDSEKNEEQFEFYLREHEDMIKKLAEFDKNARKKIYSKRYRGVLLYHLKSKNIINAFKVYIKMIKYIPIMFNKDIIVYICYRLINKDICNY